MNQFTNNLINEKSPYLLQHAHNPVNWYAWNEDAFTIAEKEDKPIFLSIGYSTCHWCHVMAHESFEDQEIARLMNDNFVSIKVDKEERPDLDEVYMAVCHMMTGHGGWPLTVFLMPDKSPFFAATYIPKENRYGRMGMRELIPRIKELWSLQRDELQSSASQVIKNLHQSSVSSDTVEIDEKVLKKAFEHLSSTFDETNGGFGSAPKFPTPHNLTFLLRYWKHTGENNALLMVDKTLTKMMRGGVYDHVGYGFHRYSTDPHWLVPHFEKMLYDQALLLNAYAESFQATGKQEYAKISKEIFTYIKRDMTSPEGGFYSAEDADSEGEEGKFYVWTADEIESLLSPEEALLAKTFYNIKQEGNYREEASGQQVGNNILHFKKSLQAFVAEKGLTETELQDNLEVIREKLFKARAERQPPHRDDKIITDWNGLMIAALAKASQVFNDKDYIFLAESAVRFILSTMRDSEGRLFHRYCNGEVAIQGFLDDYAFLVWGLIEMYEATFNAEYLEVALELAEITLRDFKDEKEGAFFFTPDHVETVLMRRKIIYDGAIPSGNSVTMKNLLRLSRITGNTQLEEEALKILIPFARQISESPAAYTELLGAVDFLNGDPMEIVIVADSTSKDLMLILAKIREQYLPNKVIVVRPSEEEQPKIIKLAEYIKNMDSRENRPTMYVCQNFSCKEPTTDVDVFLKQICAQSISKQ